MARQNYNLFGTIGENSWSSERSPTAVTTRVLTLLLLVWSVASTGQSRFATGKNVLASAENDDLKAVIKKANDYFRAFDYEHARSEYERGLRMASRDNHAQRTRFLLGIGNCFLATNQFSKALAIYNDVLKIAAEHHLTDAEVKAEVNRASIYRRMLNMTAANEAMRRVEPLILRTGDPMGLLQAANAARDIDFDRSIRLYRAGLLASQTRATVAEEATLWNQLGYALLLHGDLPQAERALTEAFRLRLMSGSKQLQSCYIYLGSLRRKQGDFQSAINLLERGLELAQQPGGTIPGGYVRQELARAYLGAGQTARALATFESAVQSVGQWRLTMLQGESYRVSGEADAQVVFAEYIQAGMAEFERTGNQRLARRMFEVAEDSRTALFRQTLLQTRELPPEYISKLKQYENALAASLDTANADANSRVARLRLELADMESGFGIPDRENSQQITEKSDSDDALPALQRKLGPSEALLSFHTGADSSFLWAVTRTSFESRRLPGAKVLQQKMASFRQNIRDRAPSTQAAQSNGSELAGALLSGLSETVLSRQDWILSLDGPLFDIPFAALPVEVKGKKAFLGELHSLRTAPTALLQDSSQEAGLTRNFAAIADPVYNGADPRAHGVGVLPVELARLPGTSREAQRCSRAWGADPHPVLLTGSAVSREAIRSVLEEKPAVLHIAAHVLPHPKSPDQVMIALGLGQTGQPDYLTPAEIATWRKPVGLVTLSGCSSGTGISYPGLGMFGLTRAWLRAGASAVVASHWPIPDDDGQLFSAMYADLGRRTEPISALAVAQSLRTAQSRMRASGGWRSDPAYWSAFFVVGKD